MLKTRVALASLLVILSACGGKKEQPAPPPPAVGYVTVAEQAVALSTELPGRTAPFETSDVRPQVNGLIRERLFTEGDIVHVGQPLYRIDPAPYLAQAASARATLAKARASIASSAALARRYGELVKINAIARQEYENSQATAAANRADVAAAQAALQSAQIDLSRTVIRAPISGRIGRSLATTGALVTAAQADPLTTIQRLDPIYVDIQQSSADLLRLREQFLNGQVARAGTTQVRIKLETGTVYGQTGTLRFADVTVSPTTGSQTIRAIVPNGSGLLLPGMFVRAVLPEGTQTRALLVPQRAVSRDEKGNATVMTVGKDNKAEPRIIQTSRAQGDNWIVTGGLKPGDKVIVEGGMMLRPGMAVNPSPYSDKPKPAAAAPAAAKPE
jgi:membrane fusion protein (multidrug efflux system)